MHYSTSSVAAAAFLSFATLSTAKRSLDILIANDDGWASANIREMYKALKEDGHNPVIVAPVINQSGTGGTVIYTTSANLTGPGEYGSVAAGSPSFGSDPTDNQINYYNGTPAANVLVGLDHIAKPYFKTGVPDLVISGPNEGSNLGPFLYTLAGTIGASYAAVDRGIPAIAFSAVDYTKRYYKYVNTTTAAGLKDPATIYGELGAKLVKQLVKKAHGGRLLPLGYGLNVNLPNITSFYDDSCIDPPFILTRLSTGAEVDNAVLNLVTGLFSYAENFTSTGVNACINGDCTLPGETTIIDSKVCKTTVSIYTVDYDAPNAKSCKASVDVKSLLAPLVEGASSSNATTTGNNATVTSPSIIGPTYTGAASKVSGSLAVAAVLGGLSMLL